MQGWKHSQSSACYSFSYLISGLRSPAKVHKYSLWWMHSHRGPKNLSATVLFSCFIHTYLLYHKYSHRGPKSLSATVPFLVSFIDIYFNILNCSKSISNFYIATIIVQVNTFGDLSTSTRHILQFPAIDNLSW